MALLVVAAAIYLIAVHAAFELGLDNGINYYDSGLFALMGQGLLHGHMPYISYLEDKPPGIFLVDAAIFLLLPANPWSVHVAGFFFAMATMSVFWWTARQVASPLPAALGTVVFAYTSTLPALTQGGNLTETYWPLPVILATGLLLGYRDDKRLWRPAVAGLACGAAILLKPQALANLLIIATLALLWAGGTWKSRVTATVSSLVSASLLVIPVLAYFWFRAGNHVMREWLAWNAIYSHAVSPRRLVELRFEGAAL